MAENKIEDGYQKIFDKKKVLKKILVAPMDAGKKDLNILGIPFWEAEVFPETESIFYRLVVNVSAEDGKNFYIKILNDWNKVNITPDQLNIINEQFGELPDRKNKYSDIACYIGRTAELIDRTNKVSMEDYVNIDVKILSIEKGFKTSKEKYRISLDIHIHDDEKVNYQLVKCNSDDNSKYEIIKTYSQLLSLGESKRQLQELQNFSEEISHSPRAQLNPKSLICIPNLIPTPRPQLPQQMENEIGILLNGVKTFFQSHYKPKEGKYEFTEENVNKFKETNCSIQ